MRLSVILCRRSHLGQLLLACWILGWVIQPAMAGRDLPSVFFQSLREPESDSVPPFVLTQFPVDPPRSEPSSSSDVQNAPGGLAANTGVSRYSQDLPDYIYEPRYYSTYGIGARPLPDYGPPGYEPRDYQDSPGVPEYSPLTPIPRPDPDEGSFVMRGMYPGSLIVPGTNTSFRVRGFVRLAGLYDFSPIGSVDSFVPNTIPVPRAAGQNYNMSARMSRLAVETWTPTDICDWNVHTLIEGDFFNGPGQAAGGGGNPFRLRHAFVDLGYFRFGQQNSVFMDPSNWPSLVDFQGANSWVNQRQPSLRITLPVADGLYWATGIERPFSDITTNGLGTNTQKAPDLSTHLRYQFEVGHIQAAALWRTIGYQTNAGSTQGLSGGSVSGSAVIHPWALILCNDALHTAEASGLLRSRFLLQGTTGTGVGRYLNDLAGQGLDGQVHPITGAFELVDASGWNASYEHWFNARWLSNFTYSEVSVDNNAGQPGTTYDDGKYLATSLWWLPTGRTSLGLEFMWGRRVNLDGQAAEAQRLNMMAQYNF